MEAVITDGEAAPWTRLRVMRDSLINCLAPLVSGVLGVVMVPLILDHYGAEAYGLVLASLTFVATATSFDLGLEWNITRDVAASQSEGGEQNDAWLASAGSAYVLIGVMGAVIIAVAGPTYASRLHLSSENSGYGAAVFFFAALGFVGDRLLAYTLAVAVGLRRFGSSNRIGSGLAVARAAVALTAMALGTSIAWYAFLQMLVSVATGMASLRFVATHWPRYRLRVNALRFDLLRKYTATGLAAALALAVSAAYWQLPQLILGVMKGATGVSHYYVAQRFPLTVLAFAGRAAIVLLPAVAEHQHPDDRSQLRDLLDVGTRWIVVLMLPASIIMAVLAPTLLTVWLGAASATDVMIIRLTSAAIFIDALSSGSTEVLWGCGMPRRLLGIFLTACVFNAAIQVVLIGRIGIIGAAYGMLGTVVVGSAMLINSACRHLGVRAWRLIAATLKGLIFPGLTCAAVLMFAERIVAPSRWASLALVSALGGVTYIAVLAWKGSRDEERQILRQILARLGRPVRA
jgi:O-antigen/teichoic acid export membrane protein